MVLGVALPVPAVDIFLNIKDIEGESTATGHEKEIVVDSWSLGLSNTVIREGGGGARAGKVKFNDIQITKRIDKSTPLLMMAASSGQPVPQAVLTISKRGEDKPVDYITITLKDVLITSIQLSGDSGDGQMSEDITINFGEIQFEYAQQKPDGTFEKPIKYGWNLLENIKK